MKNQYIDKLEQGETVKDIFMLTRKTLKEKKDGGSYAVMEFTDKSGHVEGIAWDPVATSIRSVSVDDIVFVTGTVNEYNNRLQITVQSLKQVDSEEISSEDFIPACKEDIGKVKTEIEVYLKRVKTDCLKELLRAFFEDPRFTRRFYRAPAAKRVHHACLGGLAVHTLALLKLAMHVQSIYPFLDFDLLITGCMLHDIGKVYEYSYKKKIGMSTKGRLLGHIMIGCEIVASKINSIDNFPEEMKDKILHMIVSHHGRLEWGSPRLPMFGEAIVLHQIDNLDSKVTMFKQEQERKDHAHREWSDYHNYLERELFLR